VQRSVAKRRKNPKSEVGDNFIYYFPVTPLMALDEQIEDLQYQIRKIDGHTLLGNIGNRVYGLLGLGLSSVATYHCPYLAPITIPFSVEMIGDIVTGKHHFISYRLLKIHPKYELEKLLDEHNEPTSD